MRHIHFGAGKFGLGFAGWISKHLSLDLVIVNRAQKGGDALSYQNQQISSNKQYEIEYGDGRRETIEVLQVLNLQCQADVVTLIALIAEPQTKLITTSLRNAHSDVGTIMLKGLMARAASHAKKAYVLAFENRVTSNQLRELLTDGLAFSECLKVDQAASFIDCVVDRICPNLPIVENNRIIVTTERFGRLYLGLDGDGSFFEERLSIQGRTERIIKCESDLSLRRLKKKWLFNGPHLLLAVTAFHENEFDFQAWAVRNGDLVREMLREFAIGCLSHLAETGLATSAEMLAIIKQELQQEIALSQNRFEQIGDSTGRIISQFVQPTADNPDKLEKFFSDVHNKINIPALSYWRHEGKMPYQISLSLVYMIDLIAHGRFSDYQ